MPYRVSIAYHLSVSGGASGTVTIYTVPAAVKLKVIETNVFFPTGTYGELEVTFWRGIMQLLPNTGKYTGDGLVMVDDTPAEWGSGEKVVLKYVNTNPTETRDCWVLMKGELE